MDLERILSAVDHTLLKQESTWEQIQTICEDAMHYHTATVCIPACFVKHAAMYMANRPDREAKDAIENGADEIDMVINVGWVKDHKDEDILSEINAVKAACGIKPLKVIIETCLLTEEEKIRMCDIVSKSEADYIKTSTGFSTGGATFEDIALMKAHMVPGKGIKAAGGISSLEDAERFLELGATRLGTSRIIKLVKGQKASGY